MCLIVCRVPFRLSRFWEYWCNRKEKILEQREIFDTQHIYRHKTTDEYHEWKRKHDEDLQRAIKDHPIASTFLKLSKNVNDYNMQIV